MSGSEEHSTNTKSYDQSVELVAYARSSLLKEENGRHILQPEEELMTRHEIPRQHPCFYGISFFIIIASLPILLWLTRELIDDWGNYILQRAYNLLINFTINYIAGAFFGNYLNWKTCYTRKMIHMTAFSLPLIIDAIFSQLEDAVLDSLWGLWQVELGLGLAYTIPMREWGNRICGDPRQSDSKWVYCNCLELQFNALERPEDRPNTLLWIQIQIILTYIFYIILAAVFEYNTATPMVLLIVVFVGGLGDGLAEPVGVNFGKNGCGTGKDCTFRTRGCCSKNDYTRSLPGSSMVFLSGVIGVACAHEEFTRWQLLAAFLIIPMLGTIVEAKAPHTLDNPFIVFFVGGASVGILRVIN